MRLLLENRLLPRLLLSPNIYLMPRFKMFLFPLWLNWLKVSGSPEESARVIFSTHVTASQVILKKSWERSLLSSVMKILQWLEEHALPNLVCSPLNLRSNTFSRRSFQSSDNSPRMSKIPLESCASNHWFQWLSIYLKKKIKFTLLVLFWLPVKINPGK